MLTTEARGDALWLRLDRPERRNALTVELVTELADAVEQAEERVIVITGSPPVFCAGGDLVSLGAVAEQGPLAVTDVIYSQFQRLVRALADSPRPVIAAINGAALGAGLDLAMACDFRIVTSTATLASSWVRLGLVPGMGGAFLASRAIGAARATELVLTGKEITAAKALQWGLVNEVVAEDALVAAVDTLVADLVVLPPIGLARTKAALRRALALGFEAELATLGATQGALLTGEEFSSLSARFRRS